MDLTPLLTNAQAPDPTVRKAAEDQLSALEAQNYATFLGLLVAELANEAKPKETRTLAGLMLKNALSAKEEPRLVEKQAKWRALDANAKQQIRAMLLQTLASQIDSARHTAAQVIGKIACVDLVDKQWNELIPALQANMAQPAAGLKQCTLQALGYVCEEMRSENLEQAQVNVMLTAIVQGMRKEEPDNEIRLAATNALFNALLFANENFKNVFERNFIMQVVCEGSLCSDVRVRQAAMECLVGIAQEYYVHLEPYIKDIFALTCKAVREDKQEVALQALEFWSTVAEEEQARQEYEDEDDADQPEYKNHNFIRQATGSLVPMLLETLTKQEEDQFEDDGVWNLAMAGATCLDLVARCVGNDVVDAVMPFVQRNVASANWREREAAVFAFGSILDGPEPDKISSVFTPESFKFLLNMLKDADHKVRDSTAWTLGRIIEFLGGAEVKAPLITPDLLPAVLALLLDCLNDPKPNVANKVCWALQNLSNSFEHESSNATGSLSPFLPNILQGLLAMADRQDCPDGRLRTTAYETLNAVIVNAALDSCTYAAQLIPVVLQKIQATFHMPSGTNEQQQRQAELQGLLCGNLQVIVMKLNPRVVKKAGNLTEEQSKALQAACQEMLKQADMMMQALLAVIGCRSATVHEEALLAIGALADACEGGFEKYMQALFPVLQTGLKNYEQYQVCIVTVGVIGDLCRALEKKLLPFCDSIVMILLEDLQSNELHKSVKPYILSVFGDLALGLGGGFAKYLQYAAGMLQSAAEHSVVTGQKLDADDEEAVEYNNELRNGILEAYTGIVQGLKDPEDNKIELIKPYAERILMFVEHIHNDKETRDGRLVRNAVSVLGDMADAIDGIGQLFAGPHGQFWQAFLHQAINDYGEDDDDVKFAVEFAASAIQRALAAAPKA